jgi:two-component system response regulator (stage 0 sporulation protein F)
MRISPDTRILIVDDDEGVQGLIRTLLRREGCSFASVRDGKVAIETLPGYQPDIILLDLMLPAMSGFEVLNFLALQSPSLLHRTIVLTAASESSLRELKFEDLIWKLLRKPFDIRDLIDEIAACNDFHHAAQKPALTGRAAPEVLH